MSADRWVLILLLSAGILVFFFEPGAGWFVQGALRETASVTDQMSALRENAALKASLATTEALGKTAALIPGGGYRPTFVYSRYPFSFKNELLIALGSEHGIAPGVPVLLPVADSTAESGTVALILVGKVVEVFRSTAKVQTVFDAGFQLAVRLGAEGTDAVLSGGASPTLTLIPKDAPVGEGAAVYAAGAGVPYGLPLGEVGAIRYAANQLFREAPLVLPYTGTDLKVVVVPADEAR